MYSKQDIERYILGQMSASEKVAFAEQLSSDSALKEEVKNATVAILEQMAEMKTNSGELATEAIERYIRKEMSASEAAAFENECAGNPVLAYSYKLQDSLSREVRLRAVAAMLNTKRAAKEGKEAYEPEAATTIPDVATTIPEAACADIDTYERPAAALIDEAARKEQPARVIDFSKILKSFVPIAVAACMVSCVMIWDHKVTINVGNEAYASVMRGGAELDSLVEAKDYKAAIALIDEQLNVDYEIDDPEAKAAWEEDMKDLQYQKAVILLKDGKKRQAKKILKALDDEPSRELLDKLLW